MTAYNSPEWKERMDKLREEEQRQAAADLKTRRKRRLSITLTDDQYKALQERADDCHVSVDDILSNYIADLTRIHSNGSDEREIANDYFRRTWLAHNW